MLGKGGFVACIKVFTTIICSDKIQREKCHSPYRCLQLLRPNVMLSYFIVFISPFDCWASSNCDGHASVCVNDQVGALQFGLALITASARN
jgi:hypothetical protein